MHLTFSSILPAAIALILGFLMIWLLFYVNKKPKAGVRIAIWAFWIMLLFSITAFGSTRLEAFTSRFAILSFGSFVLGIVYLILAPQTLDWWARSHSSDVFLLNLTLFCFGISGSLLVCKLVIPEEKTVLLMQAEFLFFLPSLALKAYDYWMLIPSKKYKSWMYPVHEPVPRLLPVDTIKVNMNFTPIPGSTQGPFEGYDVEYPSNVSLGDLFHYFISFHNKHREYRKKPIQFMTDDHQPLEWVMFKYTHGRTKVYLNADKTLTENQVGPDDTIYAASLNR
jgi:hypothetical protein